MTSTLRRQLLRVPPPQARTAHVLADRVLTLALQRRAEEIDAAFASVEPAIKAIAPMQFERGFVERAREELRVRLGIDVPPKDLHASWSQPLDVRGLYAHCALAVFCRLVDEGYDGRAASSSDGEPVATLIRRWGFHAVDITPCADGRLSGVVDYILRVPESVITSHKSYAGAMFRVDETLRSWESIELTRYRESVPNAATENTRYLKIGIYHFSGTDPEHQGCAAHGNDATRAADAVLQRLAQFEEAVRNVHGCNACTATLLIGVDTDTDAIRMHVPDAAGSMSADRFVDAAALYESTYSIARGEAKQRIRDVVAQCAGVAADDAATEGMRWFCGYLLKNNIGQIDAVRARFGGAYPDRGHTERLMVIGDALDDVQLRNLAFQAQMETVEENTFALDIGVKILRSLHEPRGLAVPILTHIQYDERIPGARKHAEARALRLRGAVLNRFAPLAAAGMLHVHAAVRSGRGPLHEVTPHSVPTESHA
jgi:carboxysome shell carbonic anhydrase